MKKKLVLKTPAGEPIEGSIIEVNPESRYVLILKGLPHDLHSGFMDMLSEHAKELFGDDKKRFLVFNDTSDNLSLYELEDVE